jgi:hypothetical protein
MSYTKPQIYTLTLSALQLSKEVVDVATDRSNEVRVLNMHYDAALEATLKDLDLDSLSSTMDLELIEELDEGPWTYVYKYPTNCAKLRRIENQVPTDNITTHIPKVVKMYGTQKAIYTNEYEAVIEYIPKDVSLAAFSSMAGMALVYKLALLSAPLIAGKGSKSLLKELKEAYVMAKTEAQEDDRDENFNYEADHLRSEFVSTRLE